MALTRARVVSGPPAFAARVEEVIRDVLCRKRDPAAVAADVVEMRQAIAKEKGEDARWDLKYAAGGLVDLEFIAQYLQLVHAAEKPEILDTSTARVLDKAWRLGLLSAEDADVLRPAARLYHNLTQILRLCLPGPFDPKTAGAGLLGLLSRAADLPNFATLECASRRDAAEGARELQPDFGRSAGVTPARRLASSRFRSARPCAHRRGARPDRRRSGGAARNPSRAPPGPSLPSASCWRRSAAARTRC